MKKKGFTLIELLAVIIILAIVALIATPVVLNIVEKARKEAFKDSVYGAVDAAKYYYYENPETLQVSVTDLNLTGKKFKEGIINIINGYKVENVTDGEYCANTIGNDIKIVEGNCGYEINSGSITVLLKEIGINYLTVEVKAQEFENEYYSYEYKLTNSTGEVVENWVSSQDTIHTFSNLKEDSEYIVYAKLKTEKLTKPVIREGIEKYAQKKTITITYPYYEDYNFKYYYSLDGINWIETTNKEEIIEISENCTIYARVQDGDNNYYVTYEETKIDKELPSIEVGENIEIVEGEEYNTLQGITASDNSEIYTITPNITNTKELKPGTYGLKYTVTDEAGNSIVSSKIITVTMGVDNSKANAPELGNLIAVTYDNGSKSWVKVSEQNKWYNYEKKYWANAVMLKDSSISYQDGETIPESNIKGYFVWVPRYSYKLFNLGNYTSAITGTPSASATQEIEITFEDSNTSKKTNATLGNYYTHSAFTFGDEELNGIWVAKYETSGSTSSLTVLPNVTSLRSLNVYTMFTSSYNFNRTMDSHMMKNTEWGAVAYLSHSKYGINGEIRINNSSTFTTGCAATTANGSSYSGCQNTYDTDTGVLASTTGNITGIYDMSGGVWEYMASYIYGTYGSSGFNSTNISTYDSKYFDIYPSGSTITSYNNRILGDATGEMGPFYYYSSTYHSTWYADYSNFVDTSYMWVGRGGCYSDGIAAGSFSFGRSIGTAYNTNSFRLVLAN